MIELIPLNQNHAKEMFAVLCDEPLYQYVPQFPPISEAVLRQQYAALESGSSSDGAYLWLNWVVQDKKTSHLAGYVQATVDIEMNTAEIGLMINSFFWGNGMGRYACEKMISILIAEHHVVQLTASVDPRNERSIALLEHLGFKEAFRRIESRMIHGEYCDEVVYAMDVN